MSVDAKLKKNSADIIWLRTFTRGVLSTRLKILQLCTGSLLTGELRVTWKTMAGSVVW